MPIPTIQDTFNALKSKGEKALIVFITAGDPHLSQLPAIVQAVQEGGADIIEIGVPFSDPIADGGAIQAASQRALDAGATPRGVLEALRACKLTVPIVLMGYYNPVLRYGLHAFASAASSSGAKGMIVCDLTPEEADGWIEASREHHLDTIFLAAPTSTTERLETISQRSTGFVYAVSRTGVTGAMDQVPSEALKLVEQIKKQTETPVCIGFGISKPEHVKTVCTVADGAIVGSAVVNLIHQTWDNGAGASQLTSAVRELKAATV